ncbi:MAG: hypothetical protein IJY89_04685 [Clostridia bacterium]|nr:hypothetical protein [Clostridia bacterium]
MVILINKEWGYDEKGHPAKYHLYLAGAEDPLPEDAPVGSRAVLDDGSIKVKTPAGWPQGEVTT